jgi:hypothetical protein
VICDCASCGTTIAPETFGLAREDTHEARGLCSPCYDRELHKGSVDQYPRRTRTRDEVMEDWDHLRRSGVEWRDAHQRLGVTRSAFERAYERARAAGDPRALEGHGQRAQRQRAATQAAVERAHHASQQQAPVSWASAPTMAAALNEAFGDTHELAS